ncbi:MAG TPA: glycosyltransferase, partial [Methylomirabilota bacterium]|nr:glycosyltransferase [Methylomirabilota bacterium]
LVPAFTAAGATFAPLRADRLSIGALREAVRMARRSRAQVIHSHGKGAGLYGRVAARLTGAAAVHTFHGIHHADYSRLYLTLERALARMSRAVIHVSASQAAEADALGLSPAARTHVIVNGVDAAAVAALVSRGSSTRAELGLRDDALVLATVARFDPIKALDVLLRALPLIAARLPTAQLLVVGDGPERDRLHALARGLGLGGRAVFTGAVPDAVRLVALADLYVTASRREGMPLAVLEAMACGLPVLATRVPGHTDVVQDGVTGALVPADDPAALAEAAVRLLNHRPRLAVLGQAGRKRVLQDFDRARMFREIADVYRAAVGRPPA